MILLWLTVPVAMSLPYNPCIGEIVRRNFLLTGQRSFEDVNKFNVNKKIVVPHQPYRPMNEYHLNREKGIDDALYQPFTSSYTKHVFKGDIAMTSQQLEDHLFWGRSKRVTPSKYVKSGSIWNASQPIPYYFDSSLPEESRQRARQAMSFWSDHTCLSFEEDHISTPRIRFFYGSGCWSYVGPQNQMIQQDLSIGPGCEQHENQKTYNTLGFNYEYGSVMHYSSDLFAVDRDIPVIIAKDSRHRNTMGQRMKPSFRDIYQMNSLYKCHRRCEGVKNECLFGGYPSPRNCSLCECPYGFGGDRCEGLEKPTNKNRGCGEILQKGGLGWREWYILVSLTLHTINPFQRVVGGK
uniref:ZnMc domain-containing protein n=1 Tax=Heterorhabditis bacteriophora TaxID=37862 RepID=A0A1I7XQB2_HETBA